MSITDPIADMLTSIRNAIQAKKRWVIVPSSNVRRALVDVLQSEQYIRGYKPIEGGKQSQLKIFLKYDRDNNSIITDLQRVSKPGHRVYVKRDKIPRVRSGMGTAVLSTSSGVMTDKDARQKGLGGEWLCTVW